MKKVVIYARVSKDDKASDGSMQDPHNQIDPLKKFAEAMGWEIKETFIDYASGGSANRPEFRRMLAEIKQRHIDLVLIWALDRFSREPLINTLSYIQILKDYKCGLKSLQESWLDTTNEGIGELLLAIFSWVAKEERKKISERTKAGLRRKVAQGVKLGRPKKGGVVNAPKTKPKSPGK